MSQFLIYLIPLLICLVFSIYNRKEPESKVFFLISFIPFGNVFFAGFIILFGLMFLIDEILD